MRHFVTIVLVSFLAGVLVASFFNIPYSLVGLFVLISIALCVSISISIYSADIVKKSLFLFVVVLAFSFGIVQYKKSDVYKGDKTFISAIGTRNTISGVIVAEPDTRETVSKITVLVDSLNEKNVLPNRILVNAPLYPEVLYGDKVKVVGVLERPDTFTTDTGRSFDYAKYLEKDDIYITVSRPTIEIVSHAHGNKIKSILFSFKHFLISKINDTFPEPHSSLLSGILLGGKQSLGKKLLDQFTISGVVHVVVLSGYNIAIVVALVMKMFSRFGRKSRTVLAILAILLFAIMTGATSTVVRASIMALLYILSQTARKNYDITRALLVAGCVMVFYSPRILVFDVSFQLSCLSTFALIYVSPIVENWLQFITKKYHIRDIVVATVATQIFVLPFILYKIGTLSIVALPVNLLVLPAIPFAMLGGAVALCASFWHTLAFIVGIPAYILLDYVLKVVKFASSLPFSSVNIPAFPWWVAVFIYIIFGYFMYRFYRQSKKATP